MSMDLTRRNVIFFKEKPSVTNLCLFFTPGTSVIPEVFPGYGMSSSIKLNLLPPTYLTMSVCIGNHEYVWPSQPWRPDWSYSIYGKDGGGEGGIPYSLRFKMPGNSSFPTFIGSPKHSKSLLFL